MDAMNLPPGDADVTNLSGGERRRVALCKMLLRTARPAAARRTDEPSRRRERGLARTAPGRVPRHGRRRDARSLLPRQRRRLDSGTRPRPRHSLGRQLLVVAASRRRTGWRRKRRPPRARQKTLDHELEWIRMAPAGPAGQEQGPHQGLREDGGRSSSGPRRRARNPDSARQAPGRSGRRGQEAVARATATSC